MSNIDDKWKLGGNPQEQHFEVPKNYFEKLEQQTMIEVNELENPTKRGIWQMLKPAMGLAASFIVVGLLVYVPMKLYMPSIMDKYYTVESQSVMNGDSTRIYADLDAINFFAIDEDAIELESDQIEESNEDVLNYLVAELDEYEIAILNDLPN